MGDGPDGYYHLRRDGCAQATVSVALAEAGRGGEIRQFGVFENRPETLRKTGGAVEQRKASPELLLRGRSVRLWAASAINRLRA